MHPEHPLTLKEFPVPVFPSAPTWLLAFRGVRGESRGKTAERGRERLSYLPCLFLLAVCGLKQEVEVGAWHPTWKWVDEESLVRSVRVVVGAEIGLENEGINV